MAILKRSTTDALRAKNLLIGFELPLSVGGEPFEHIILHDGTVHVLVYVMRLCSKKFAPKPISVEVVERGVAA